MNAIGLGWERCERPVPAQIWSRGRSGPSSSAREVSLKLPTLYATLADTRGDGLLDAGSVIEVNPGDGNHFEAETHRSLWAPVAETFGRLEDRKASLRFSRL